MARRVRSLGPGIIALVVSLVLAGCVQAPAVVPGQPIDPSAQVEASCPALPTGFSYLSTTVPPISVELRYATTHNFTGKVVDGYEAAAVGVLREEAASALATVQAEIASRGLSLLVFDAYRPIRAVDFFVEWAESDDDSTQAEYYPAFDKPELFSLGYIAEHSNHSLGGTVDLTLVDLASGQPLDMGGAFDLFDTRSHYEAEGLTPAQFENRTILRMAMIEAGFDPYPQEWWHFSYPVPPGSVAQNFVIGPC